MTTRKEQLTGLLACVLIMGSLGALSAVKLDTELERRYPTCEASEKPPEAPTCDSFSIVREVPQQGIIPAPNTH